MEFVPEDRAGETEDVSNDESDNNEGESGDGIECLDHVNRIDHMGPENEIDDRLRPTQQNEHGPKDMPAGDQRANNQTNLIRICHWFSFLGSLRSRELQFWLGQFFNHDLELGGADWFSQASLHAIGESGCGGVIRVARGHDNYGQLLPAGLNHV